MPVLTNQRHERFAQSLAAGKSASAAYEEAGYVPNRRNASVLKTNQDIINRVKELQEKRQERFVLSKQYVLDSLIENAEIALGRKPIKVGLKGAEREVYVYKGDVANAAIKLAGLEVGMFTERKDFRITTELDNLSDLELVATLAREAQTLLLEDHSGDEETEPE